MFKWFRNRIELLKNDKQLTMIMLLNIVLMCLHVYEWHVGDIEYYWSLRAGLCGLVAIGIFFLGRKGLAWSLIILACTLIYINDFYNYATIFFLLVAMGAYPKLRKVAQLIYLVNLFIAYTIKRLEITLFATAEIKIGNKLTVNQCYGDKDKTVPEVQDFVSAWLKYSNKQYKNCKELKNEVLVLPLSC